jgi:hypothetical protein
MIITRLCCAAVLVAVVAAVDCSDGFVWSAVPDAAFAAPVVTINGRAHSIYLNAGQTQTFVATVRSNEPLGSVLVDFEVHDTLDVKVFQAWKTVQIPANRLVFVTERYRVARTVLSGVYRLQLGVFGSTWKPLYAWNDSAAQFLIQGRPRPEISVGGQVEPRTVHPGESVTLTETIAVHGRGMSNILADIEVDRGSTKVYQYVKTGVHIPGNRIVRITGLWVVPARERSGTYIINVGVFSSQWSHLYAWDGGAARLVIRP